MRVLAFEDSYDLEAMLSSAEINLDEIVFLQRWNSSKPLEAILEFKPDVLLLDFFMPPFNGAQVLAKVIQATEQGSTFSSKADHRDLKRSTSQCTLRTRRGRQLGHQIRPSHPLDMELRFGHNQER